MRWDWKLVEFREVEEGGTLDSHGENVDLFVHGLVADDLGTEDAASVGSEQELGNVENGGKQ